MLLPLSAGANIVGKTVSEAALSTRFHSAVVAIKRNNLAIDLSKTKIADEVLQASAQGTLSAVCGVDPRCPLKRAFPTTGTTSFSVAAMPAFVHCDS